MNTLPGQNTVLARPSFIKWCHVVSSRSAKFHTFSTILLRFEIVNFQLCDLIFLWCHPNFCNSVYFNSERCFKYACQASCLNTFKTQRPLFSWRWLTCNKTGIKSQVWITYYRHDRRHLLIQCSPMYFWQQNVLWEHWNTLTGFWPKQNIFW